MTTNESYDLLNTILERDYYVPDVTELCIGFEWYRPVMLSNSEGSKNLLLPKIIESKFDLYHAFDVFEAGGLYVKKLDVKDIESFGFKDITILPDKAMFFFSNNNLNLSLDKDNVIIVKDIDVVFRGKLKNKTELKRVLKQIDNE